MSLRTALGLGGLFAVSSVLPDQVEHLAAHLLTVQTSGWTSALAHLLPPIGCFVLLSVLTWLSEADTTPQHPLAAYPPQQKRSVLAHSAGLATGLALLVSQIGSQ